MPTVEHSIAVQADADTLFVYFSEVGNLPEYLPSVRRLFPVSDGWKLEWNSDCWLQVEDSPEGSLLTVHLSAAPDEGGVQRSLESIKHELELRGGQTIQG